MLKISVKKMNFWLLFKMTPNKNLEDNKKHPDTKKVAGYLKHPATRSFIGILILLHRNIIVYPTE
jgi:hypothetical protein